MDAMNRDNARRAPTRPRPGWATAPRHRLSLVHADRVPLLALFLGVRARLRAFGALAEDVWGRAGVAGDAP